MIGSADVFSNIFWVIDGRPWPLPSFGIWADGKWIWIGNFGDIYSI